MKIFFSSLLQQNLFLWWKFQTLRNFRTAFLHFFAVQSCIRPVCTSPLSNWWHTFWPDRLTPLSGTVPYASDCAAREGCAGHQRVHLPADPGAGGRLSGGAPLGCWLEHTYPSTFVEQTQPAVAKPYGLWGSHATLPTAPACSAVGLVD